MPGIFELVGEDHNDNDNDDDDEDISIIHFVYYSVRLAAIYSEQQHYNIIKNKK